MATDKRIGFSQVLYAKLAGFVDRYIGIFIPGRLLKIRKLKNFENKCEGL